MLSCTLREGTLFTLSVHPSEIQGRVPAYDVSNDVMDWCPIQGESSGAPYSGSPVVSHTGGVWWCPIQGESGGAPYSGSPRLSSAYHLGSIDLVHLHGSIKNLALISNSRFLIKLFNKTQGVCPSLLRCK